MLLRFVQLTCLLGLSLPARAGVIAAIRDTGYLGFGPAIFGQFPTGEAGGQAVTASWTTASEFSDVSIRVPLSLWSPENQTYSGRAFLTTSIGPGTATAVAETTFTRSNTSPQQVELFNNLTLAAGTYYLTLTGLDLSVGAQPGYIWSSAAAGTPTFRKETAAGVTINPPLFACNYGGGCAGLNYAFPPASDFAAQSESTDLYLQFEVSTVPEPATLWLLGFGLVMVCRRARRR